MGFAHQAQKNPWGQNALENLRSHLAFYPAKHLLLLTGGFDRAKHFTVVIFFTMLFPQ
jgi:hypothetical protein